VRPTQGMFRIVALRSRVSCGSVSALTRKCRNHWLPTSRVRSSKPGQTAWRSAWSVFNTRTRSYDGFGVRSCIMYYRQQRPFRATERMGLIWLLYAKSLEPPTRLQEFARLIDKDRRHEVSGDRGFSELDPGFRRRQERWYSRMHGSRSDPTFP